jgi:hypothetical protein
VLRDSGVLIAYEVSPDTVDFGDRKCEVGASLSASIIVANTGTVCMYCVCLPPLSV